MKIRIPIRHVPTRAFLERCYFTRNSTAAFEALEPSPNAHLRDCVQIVCTLRSERAVKSCQVWFHSHPEPVTVSVPCRRSASAHALLQRTDALICRYRGRIFTQAGDKAWFAVSHRYDRLAPSFCTLHHSKRCYSFIHRHCLRTFPDHCVRTLLDVVHNLNAKPNSAIGPQ